MTPKKVLELAKKEEVVMVDCRITDWPGSWQHCSHPIWTLDEATFEDGYGFDGSSIRGWQAINESDMLMIPDPSTAFIDPFMQHKTLVLICDVCDPITREKYSRDPRHIAKKAEAYLKQTGIGDTSYFGPEAEFFVFNSARFHTATNEGFYHIDSNEGIWNAGSVEGGAWQSSSVPTAGFPKSDGYLDDIAKYCLADCKATVALYMKLRSYYR